MEEGKEKGGGRGRESGGSRKSQAPSNALPMGVGGEGIWGGGGRAAGMSRE